MVCADLAATFHVAQPGAAGGRVVVIHAQVHAPRACTSFTCSSHTPSSTVLVCLIVKAASILSASVTRPYQTSHTSQPRYNLWSHASRPTARERTRQMHMSTVRASMQNSSVCWPNGRISSCHRTALMRVPLDLDRNKDDRLMSDDDEVEGRILPYISAQGRKLVQRVARSTTVQYM